MKAYDEDAKYILFINKSITILGCSTVNSLTIGFLGHISQQIKPINHFKRKMLSSSMNTTIVSKLNISQTLIPILHILINNSAKQRRDGMIYHFGLTIDLRMASHAEEQSSTKLLPQGLSKVTQKLDISIRHNALWYTSRRTISLKIILQHVKHHRFCGMARNKIFLRIDPQPPEPNPSPFVFLAAQAQNPYSNLPMVDLV